MKSTQFQKPGNVTHGHTHIHSANTFRNYGRHSMSHWQTLQL